MYITEFIEGHQYLRTDGAGLMPYKAYFPKCQHFIITIVVLLVYSTHYCAVKFSSDEVTKKSAFARHRSKPCAHTGAASVQLNWVTSLVWPLAHDRPTV